MKRFNQFFLLLMIGIFAFACESDPPKDETPINNTVTVGLRNEPDMLHPILSTGRTARTVYRHMFLRVANADPYTLEYRPVLAKKMPTVEAITEGEYAGGYKYTVEFREEARWGNGKPVLASDYVFTIKAVMNPKVNTRWRSAFDVVKDIQIDPTNPRKFSIYASECNINLEENICTTEVYPESAYDPDGLLKPFSIKDLANPEIAKKLADENENLGKFAEQFASPDYTRDPNKIVGSGAYKFKEWTTKQRLVLEKKKDWWGTQFADTNTEFTANPDKLIYIPVPNMETAVAMLKDGGLDVMSQLQVDLYKDLKTNEAINEAVKFETPEAAVYYFFLYNMDKPMLSDKRVREAISSMLDLGSYIKNQTDGLATRVTAPFHTSKPYYDKSLQPVPFDLKKAVALLEEAGWKDSNNNGTRDKNINGELVELELEINMGATSTVSKTLTAMLKEEGKKIGVGINAKPIDFRVLIREKAPKGDFDILALGAGLAGRLDDPTTRFHTESFPPEGVNYGRFGTAESDALIEQIRSNCNDETARNVAYKAFQKIVAEEHPSLFLFTNPEIVAINKRFDNAKGGLLRPSYYENYFIAKR